MEKHDIELISISDPTKLYRAVRMALVCGFFMQVAHKEGEKGSYLTVKDNQVGFHYLRIARQCFYSFPALYRLLDSTQVVDWTPNPTG